MQTVSNRLELPSKTPASSLLTDRNITHSTLFQKTEAYFKNLIEPGLGNITQASDPVSSPDGKLIAFVGHTWRKIEGLSEARICLIEAATGATLRIVGEASQAEPYQDTQPQFSPDGTRLSFLSNRGGNGEYQCYFLCGNNFEKLVLIAGLKTVFVEYTRWHSDSTKLLLGVAGSRRHSEDIPSWAPEVQADSCDGTLRSLVIYDCEREKDLDSARFLQFSVWEAVWCGPHHAVGIISDGYNESAWYSSRVSVLDLLQGTERIIYNPPVPRQVGAVVASGSGKYAAFVEALSNSRGGVVGNVILVDVDSSEAQQLQLGLVDVTSLTWVDETRLFYHGFNGAHTVVGEIDVVTRSNKVHWTTEAASYGVTPMSSGGFAIITGSWGQYPRISMVEGGIEKILHSFMDPGKVWLKSGLGEGCTLTWKSLDGVEIQGFLRLPKLGKAPYPLILHCHGGPISCFKNIWPDIDISAFLTANGYAVFCPNPRGSTGRGQDFIGQIFGNMGGVDCQDLLSGIEHLVQAGVASRSCIGVTGGSYGGFMTNWIVTQTDIFAAGVALSPIADWVSLHGTSNIPSCDRMLLNADPYCMGGEYQKRSPLMFAGRYRTPVLQIAGKNDPCTPPTQAEMYHRAMAEKGVESACVLYPGEGHRIRKFPAYIDYCARLLGWFEQHMPVKMCPLVEGGENIARI
ncbi:hypothetical protein ACJ72_05027 [Emergomyces africanus]|uniref:Dipeptidyl-peptidase V n=1 Tax=Emergomyces africanus TaxID=1955775 RepID=A0A1B7NV23_9EURO|nr:hypothetical protein ACJ72_05027 [Emergomyces africanus]